MPKGKRKGKFEHKRTEQAYSSDEDAGIDMTIDNCSEASLQSDLKSNHEDPEYAEPGTRRRARLRRLLKVTLPPDLEENDNADRTHVDPVQDDDHKNDIQEKFEEKVLELIDALGARANAARAGALVSLRAALQRRPLGALLAPHRATLADHAARALRRGRDAERKAAAAVAPLLALQIGDEGTEQFVSEVRPALAAAAVDKTASVDTRAECCSSLAVLCFMLEEDISEILEVMRIYETIFSGSYLKGDGSVKVSGAAVEEGACHAAALEGWALLVALVPPRHAAALMTAAPPSLARLATLLHAAELEVRLSAGTALAVAYERITLESEPEYAAAAIESALPLLQQLSRDSHKYRAKRDRKQQRATFRDILKYFEEDEVPVFSVRVGQETVTCDTWRARTLYTALAAALGGGLQALAPVSGPLRECLGLSDTPPAPLTPHMKPNKLQRHLQNNAADKARTVARGKNRDKRSAALAL